MAAQPSTNAARIGEPRAMASAPDPATPERRPGMPDICRNRATSPGRRSRSGPEEERLQHPLTSARLTYRFGPLERRGILGPVRLGQAAMLGAGALLAIVVLDRAPSAGGALMATVASASRWRSRSHRSAVARLEEWCPIVAAFAVGGSLAGTRFARRFRRAASAVRRGAIGSLEPALPVALRGVRIVERRLPRPAQSALLARGERRLTAVLACRVVSFSLLDPEAQERRLARWGLVLSGAAEHGDPADPVDRAHGAGAGRRARALAARRARSGDAAARHADDRVLPGADRDDRQGHAGARDPGRGPGRRAGASADAEPTPSKRALVEETERVAQGLEAAEVTVLGALSPGQLARTLRTAFDPYARAELAALETADPRPGRTRRGATPGRSAPTRGGTTTAATAPCTRPTGSAGGRGSTSRRCSWTRCSAARAWCARWR